jgi:large subunit ribosomal protein L10
MRAEKQYLIAEVESYLKKADFVILANFTGVSVAETAELRDKLAVAKAEYHVVKNSSLRVAASALGLPDLSESLVGPTAIVVGTGDAAGVAKVIKGFFDVKKKLEIKVGVLENKIVSAADLTHIAELPPFEVLRAQFLSVLNGAAGAFVRVLDARVKKEEPASSGA